MTKHNIDIEVAIISAGLKKYQVAEMLNVNDGNFSRLLRKELSETEKANIFKIIENLKREK